MTTNDSQYSEERGPQVSARDVLTIVFKRRKTILLFAAVVVVIGVSVAVLSPPVYVVSATLLVNQARAEVPLAPTESSQVFIDNVNAEALNSEVEVLRSRRLIEEVLEIIGIDESGEQEVAWYTVRLRSLREYVRSLLGREPLSRVDQMVLHLLRTVKVERITGSTAIRVSYQSKDPDWATQVVRVLTERYIERRVERYQSSQVVSFFERQMGEAQERLSQREADLEEFARTAGITITKGPQNSDSLSAQKALVLDRLARFQNDRADAETDMQEQSRRLENLRLRLGEEPERLESANRNLRDASTEVIKEQLTELELERDSLLQDFKPDSRYVRDIETQIELARTRLEELQAGATAIEGTETNPIYQSLKQELLRAEAEHEGTQARFASLSIQVDDYRNELENLNKKAFELEGLRREAQAAEEEYLLYRKKLEEARISAAMDQQKLINVTIAQPAQRPLKPRGRDLRAMMFFAMVAGVVGGLGLAFGTELYLDHSFTTGHEIERRLGIPHIASIPEGGWGMGQGTD
jgi:uncharacterized protein involved in exopolysaccharide biosynthesis